MTLEFEARATVGTFSYEAAFTARDEVVVLFGHSGAGKSVTLQFIAGLMKPAAGRIVVGDRVVFDSSSGADLAPQERQVGYVVQELALFPQMTAAQNIGFAVPRGPDRKQDIIEKVIKPTIPQEILDEENVKYYVNPTGRFVVGGPMGDTGLKAGKLLSTVMVALEAMVAALSPARILQK